MSKKDVRITVYSENEGQKNDNPSLTILGADISRFPRQVQFFIATFGVFFFYVIYGSIQELIFRFKAFKPYGWYLTWVQFAIYAGFASLELRVTNPNRSKRSVPVTSFGLLSFLTVATMGLSNSSVGYLNYPTHVIFKSCKLIPTMIGGVFIQGKRYGLLDVVAVLSMCGGLAMFTLADSTVQPAFNAYGVLLISLALCADGAIGNVQERVMKTLGVSNVEIILYSYGLGFLLIFAGLLTSGQFLPAFLLCLRNPVETYVYAIFFSITGYVGIQCVLVLVKLFGALPAVTVTTCRKSVTIVLSFLVFSKPFTISYVWSGFLVVFGIYLSLYAKNRSRWNQALRNWYRKRKGVMRHPSTIV